MEDQISFHDFSLSVLFGSGGGLPVINVLNSVGKFNDVPNFYHISVRLTYFTVRVANFMVNLFKNILNDINSKSFD